MADAQAQAEDALLKEWRAGISNQVSALSVQIGTVKETMATRADVKALQSSVVDRDAYAANNVNTNERLTRLENGPQRLLGWFGLGIGCLSLLSTFAIGLTGLILVLIFHGH